MRGTPSASTGAAWLRATGRGAGLGCLTGLVVAGIDTSATLRGFDGPKLALAAYALSSLILACGALGAALGLWTGILNAALPRSDAPLDAGATPRSRVRSTLRALLLGLPAAAFVAWVPTSWITEHWAGLGARAGAIAVLVYPGAWLACAAAAALVDAAVRRYARTPDSVPRYHAPLLAAATLLAAASYWADRSVLVDLYDDFHYGLTGLFVSSVALLLALVLRTPAIRDGALLTAIGRRSTWIRRVTLGLALAMLIALELLDPDVFGPSRSVVFAKLVASARDWTDFDGDGPSSLFGGSDCAPFDPEVMPGKFDVPGDGRDEDCSGTAAQWPAPETATHYAIPDAAGLNLLLITIDALRADHLGAWGYTRRPTSPNIDRLAAQSLRFARAFAPTPKTYDSLPCLLSGLYPSNVPRDYDVDLPPGKDKPYIYRITHEIDLLPEILQRNGYVTGAALVSLLHHLELDRGFDEHQITTAPTDYALDFLQRRVVDAPQKQPFFLWLHYYSPHFPYVEHEGITFGDEDIDRYDGEIAYDDRRIGALLAGMEQRGLLDRTVVVLSADHGEEFRDHGGTEHGFRLYSELTNVPLLLKIPGVAPRVVKDVVELADVTPTLCELLRLRECGDHDGHSLFEAVAGKRDPERGAYSEMYRKNDVLLMSSLFTDKWRVIFDYKKDRSELYDVRSDPHEQKNVASQHPELVRTLRDRLATRTLYRQGQVFQRFRDTKQSLMLAKGLHLFRRRQLLSVVLKLIERDVGPQHVPYLKKLLKRPGLDSKSKKKARALIARGHAVADADPH